VTTWTITECDERDENNCPRYDLTSNGQRVLKAVLNNEAWDTMIARIEPGDTYTEENKNVEPVHMTYREVMDLVQRIREFDAEARQ